MAKTLEVTFRANTQQFTKGIGKMNSALIHLQNNVNKVNGTTAQVVNVTNKATTAEHKAAEGANQWSNATKNVNSNLRKSGTLVDGIAQKLRMLASTYLGVMGAKALISTSDAMTGAENKLNYVNAQTMGNDLGYTTGASGEKTFSNATLDATASTMEKIFRISQQARTGYTDMVSNVSKSMMLAGNAFGNNVDNAIRFQQIMAEAYTVGGASAAEQASSMYQMVQALGSGILAGDELRSVREGAPLAYKAIEEFAQGVYDTTDSLKDMASEGMITSDIVVAGILSAGDKLDEAFQSTTMTFAQMWTVMKSSATHSFMPVFDEMRKQMTIMTQNGFFENFTQIMEGVATVATYIVKVLGGAIRWIGENWDWLKIIALGALAVIGEQAMVTAVKAMVAFGASIASMAAPMKITLLMFTIVALTYAALSRFVMGESATTAQTLITAILLVTSVTLACLAIVKGSTALALLAVITGVLGAVAISSNSISDMVGKIVGAGTATIQVVKNVGNWFRNVFSAVSNVFKALCDNMPVMLDNAMISIRASFLKFKSTASNVIADVADKLNKLPFVNIDVSGLRSASDNYYNQAQDLLNTKHGMTSSLSEAWQNGINKYEYGSVDEAYNKGYDLGGKLVAKVKEKISGLTNIGSLGDPSNLNLNTDSIDDISSGVGNLDDTTKKISDKMDTTIEDLQYLRDLAELEWKKEYTVASINVDMTNNNTVNGTSDLDGIVTKLSDMLYQELNEVAEGVYTM